MDTLANIRTERQMIAPRPVDASERDRALCVDDGALAHHGYERSALFRGSLPDARCILPCQDRVASLDDQIVLLLDNRGIPGERPANLEVLTLDDPLRARDLTLDDRAVDGRRRISGEIAWE